MKRLFAILICAACCGTAGAQERFDYVQRRNPWNGEMNAAGIRQDTVSRSYAEIYFMKENGGLVDYSASDDSWTAGAHTASIRHFDKVSFAGRFAYDYFDGRNMCGSMFTRPGYYPVDLYEFTPGRKIRESFALEGSVAAVLAEHWTTGLKAGFSAGNYAKRKDLRHKNKRLDLEVAPGLLYHRGAWAVGVAYLFGRNSERVEADEIGTSAGSYQAFLDKGLAYGVLERWDGSGTHLDESGISGFPIREMTHGVGVQGQYGPLQVEVAWRSRSGESGERDSWWYDFDASQATARATLTLRSSGYEHFVRVHAERERLDNRERILRRETIDGIATVLDFGTLPIFERRSWTAGTEYEIRSERFDLRAGLDWERLGRRSTLCFPYVREQQQHALAGFARGRVTCGAWEVSLGADFRQGGFSEEAFEQDTPLETQSVPVQLTDCYDYANEYFTAPRLGAEAGVRRNIGRFYVDLSVRWEHGFDLRRIPEADRVRALLGVGYNF